MTNEQRLRSLKNSGVEIIDPATTRIAEDVELARIEPGVRIYGGCRIAGKSTLIGQGTTIGREGPAAVEDCAIGRDVELRGGSFRGSVFLDRSGLGPGAHLRAGCLLEEEASGAHTVGLKQTILFPFVTLGSLVNFCDCLMAGGTSLQNHGEVGSSYVHFNFTPNQDKAPPSLIGDVPRGVMLDQRPVFLGGQGGLVGPARVGFGSVIAAGIVCRADVGENVLVAGVGREPKESPYRACAYLQISRKVKNNISYIANLAALKAWYAAVRSRFLNPGLLHEAVAALNGAVAERVFRLKELAEKMSGSVDGLKELATGGIQKVIRQQNEFHSAWPKLEDLLGGLAESNERAGDAFRGGFSSASMKTAGKDGVSSILKLRDGFLDRLVKTAGVDYLGTIRALDADAKRQGTSWLSAIVASVEETALSFLPSF